MENQGTNRSPPRQDGFIQTRVEQLLFASRWIQAPMFLGLTVASALYCYKFLAELVHLTTEIGHLSEEALLLGVLGLVDVTMVSNLIFMVVLGGYSLFVSRIDIDTHPDRPEWLDKTNSATLKIKLASSLVGVSGIHLLKSFINIEQMDSEHVKWQVLIHLTFLLSTVLLAWGERILHPPHAPHA
jgi:uncharacterized protein (TIGR00645 family)